MPFNHYRYYLSKKCFRTKVWKSIKLHIIMAGWTPGKYNLFKMEGRCQSQSQRAYCLQEYGEGSKWRGEVEAEGWSELAAGGGEAIQMMRCTLCKVVFGENFSRKITIFKHENITFNFFDLHNDFNMIISEKSLAQCTY